MISRNIVFFSHSLGQLKNGVGHNMKHIKPFVKSPIYHVSCQKNIFKNLSTLHDVNTALYGNLINIGGDHSMAIATVSSTMKKYNDAKVIWIDAHPDINTFESSETKNYHGMPLAYLTGLQSDKQCDYIKNKLNFKNILYIGIRDIDHFEKSIIQDKGIKVITMDDIQSNMSDTLETIRNFIGTSPIHLSFDVDVLDPSIMPGTGTPVPNGIKLEEAKTILDELYNYRIVNMDITELNLDDFNEDAREKSLKTFVELFGNRL